MGIQIVIDDARVVKGNTAGWYVSHPSNDAILAYCDTKEEAAAVRKGINDMAKLLREVGHKVR